MDAPFNSLSIVVPTYNSEQMLPTLVERLDQVLSRLAPTYEIILVNDGSQDRSWEAIERLARQNRRVIGINLSRNYGQHNALLCGIKTAQYEIIITMDDDLQNPPEEIPKLLYKMAEGYDVVYGVPVKGQHNFWRNITSNITKLAIRHIIGVRHAQDISTFRAIRGRVLGIFHEYKDNIVSIDVLLSWVTTKFYAIPVTHYSRQSGTSNYTLFKLINHAMTIITGFSVLPLQLAIVVGIIFILFGTGILLYVIIYYFTYGSIVPGFFSLAAIISLFSGAQLFSIGIIGEYLGRLFVRSMGRPPFFIRDKVSLGESLSDDTYRSGDD